MGGYVGDVGVDIKVGIHDWMESAGEFLWHSLNNCLPILFHMTNFEFISHFLLLPSMSTVTDDDDEEEKKN